MNVSFYASRDGHIEPKIYTLLVGRSTYIRAGDLLVWTTVSYRTTSSRRVVRPAYNADRSTFSTNGIAGVALYSIRTNANGAVVARNVADHAVALVGPQVSASLHTLDVGLYDPDTQLAQIAVAAWDPENLFAIPVHTGSKPNQFPQNTLGYLVELGNVAVPTATEDTTALRHTVSHDSTGNGNSPFIVLRVSAADAERDTAGRGIAIVQPRTNHDALFLNTPYTT